MKTCLKWIGLCLPVLALLVLAPIPHALAATTNVGCSVAELIAAINNANANAGADTLELATNCDYVLTAPDNTDGSIGPNGLPRITSEITVNGNNATIERSAADGTPVFRLIYVNSAGTLSLNHLTLLRGDTDLHAFRSWTANGSGIYNDGGKLTVQAVTFKDNLADAEDLVGTEEELTITRAPWMSRIASLTTVTPLTAGASQITAMAH